MMRGATGGYFIGGKKYPITKLLSYEGVRSLLFSRSTPGLKRNLLRALLKAGKVTAFALSGAGATLAGTYGSHRRRAGEPLRTKRGEIVEGPSQFREGEEYMNLDPELEPPSESGVWGPSGGT